MLDLTLGALILQENSRTQEWLLFGTIHAHLKSRIGHDILNVWP